MALPIIPLIYRVTLNWRTPAGLTAHNVLHFAGAASDPTAINTAITNNVTTDMWKHTGAGVAIESIDVLELDGTAATHNYATDGTAKWGGVGTLGDVLVAPAALVSLGTGLRGPRHRGRVYLPFPKESVTAGGLLGGSILADVTAVWQAFDAAMDTDLILLVVASYVHQDFELVTSLTCETALATQRRRQDQLR